ncbi:MAG: hypothetical protein CMH79_06075 [Nitrospinae bacterium]|nr:hypothetical protein [Nitrospinota bacterium]|tara:strand:- start:325 stop:576 length:252 start_codon:yes stop_codon:yes gene_type:complete
MNFSQYPIQDSNFYITNTVEINKEKNCLQSQGYNKECKPDVLMGYHKPIKEGCKFTTNNPPLSDGCTSIWNNMTKRKSLVKDY